MDPKHPLSFSHQKLPLATNRKYHFVDQRPNKYSSGDHPTLLCIHGFPGCWVDWKYQIKPWVEKGYRVVVPDMLGYGQTDKPENPEEYSLKKISDDLASILRKIGVDKAFVIGHDWGSHIAGRFALWHPEMVLGVVHISIGYFPPNSKYEPLEVIVKDTIYEYQLYFANWNCIRELEENARNFFRYAFHTHVFSGPNPIPKNFGDIVTRRVIPDEGNGRFLLNDEELDYIMSQNKELRGPTNYYRTWEIRCREEKNGGLPKTYQGGTPVLFLRGDQDRTSAQSVADDIKRLYGKDATVITYRGAAHWLMIEKKEEVTEGVLRWLTMVRPPPHPRM